MSPVDRKGDWRDPTQRFGDRVTAYRRHRPDYPVEILAFLQEEAGLTPTAVVADVGAGTGILSSLFLTHGNIVYAVEPNDAMRIAAEASLGGDPLFHSVAGRAEKTGLPDGAVDLVVVGQAFHWFELEPTRRELRRILRPGGKVALVWNVRRTRGTAFLKAYEAFIEQWGTDYREQRRVRRLERSYRIFFGSQGWRSARFANAQALDEEGLRGRFLSSSYAPGPGHPNHEGAMEALTELYRAHSRDGRIHIDYDTEVIVGVPAPGRG